jgi:hypothetical protein
MRSTEKAAWLEGLQIVLRDRMDTIGVDVAELHLRSGIPASSIRRYLTGRDGVCPQMASFIDLAHALKMSEVDLLSRVGMEQRVILGVYSNAPCRRES